MTRALTLPNAWDEGSVVASNLLEGNHRTPNYAGIPSVVFTTPPLARVGPSEEAAHEQGLRFAVHHGDHLPARHAAGG